MAPTDDKCRLLLSTLDRHEEVTHLLFAGGSPCQGFSRANPNSKVVRDPRSALIWVFHALSSSALTHFKGKASVAVVLENVVMKDSAIEKNITKLFGTNPQGASANLWTACDRDRNFWSSYPALPLPELEKTSPDFGAILSQGWMPLWELSKSGRRPRFSCFLRPWPPDCPPGNVTSFWKFSLHRYGEHGLVYRPDALSEVLRKIEGLVEGMRSNDRGFKKAGTAVHSARSDLCKWIHAEGGYKYLRPLNADERDLAMGFPAGASRLPADYPRDKLGEEFGRCLLSGNAWAPPAASHVLGHLSIHILKNQTLVTYQLRRPRVQVSRGHLGLPPARGPAILPEGG